MQTNPATRLVPQTPLPQPLWAGLLCLDPAQPSEQAEQTACLLVRGLRRVEASGPTGARARHAAFGGHN